MTDELLGLPLWLVIALPFAKILATSFSIGSGGSGGIFGPGMVIGGMLGATFWRLGDGVLPHLPDSPAPFVIVGMMALFGSIAHAPFAVMLMVAEMTGNLSLLAPAMIAIAIATMLVGDHSIYWAQLPNRAASPAHRLALRFPLLAALTTRGAMTPIATEKEREVEEGEMTIDVRMRLDEAMLEMAEGDVTQVTITDNGKVVGSMSYRDALVAYRKMLDSGLQRAEELPVTSMLLEYKVGPTSPVANLTLRETTFPEDTLVVAIRHENDILFPQADTRLAPGDMVTVLGKPESGEVMRKLIQGDT